jgi:probable F420-dependent oxidoreductase
MAANRPFRFGALAVGGYDAKEWTDFSQRLEAEGFDTLLVADHYDNPMACTPLIMAAAAATTTLRVGSYVYDNDFRHPALLAKEAATIDVLSNGRLELGVGAGWFKPEYDAAGIPFDPGSVRASRFEEGIEVMTRLFTGEAVNFEGQHYHLTEMKGMPIPVQKPIPLLVGGGGPRMIRFAARKAQIVGFVPQSLPQGGLDPAKFSVEALDSRIKLLDEALAETGRTDAPERSVLVFGLNPSGNQLDIDAVPRDLLATSPYALLGDVDAMVDTIMARRERWGLTYFVCWDYDVEKFIPVVRRLGGRVAS